jgi:membrane-associated protein
MSDLLGGDAGYAALFLACAGAGIVLPMTEDVPLLYAGIRIANGDAKWIPTLLVAIAGVLVRDLLAFLFGRVLGSAVLERPLVVRILGARRIERATRLVQDRGPAAVMIGRFLVGMRSPVFVVAGAGGVPPTTFLLVDGIGLCIAVPIALILGHQLGPTLVAAAASAVAQTRLVGIVVAALAGGWIARRLWVRRRLVLAAASDTAEIDAIDELDDDDA